MEAARNGHVDMVRGLLTRGAKTEFVDGDGRTALWWAVYRGRREVSASGGPPTTRPLSGAF
jgi:ankyrin repeat protein